MSRAYYSDGNWDLEDYWPWIRHEGALAATLRGRRTYQLLCELETALLSMPQPRLIGHYLAKDGEVCAIGALYCHRARSFGDQWGMAAERLEYLYGDAEDDADAREATRSVSVLLGLSPTMGQTISERNDDPPCTPEERWTWMLSSVRHYKAEHERLVVKATAQRIKRQEKKKHAANATARRVSVPRGQSVLPLAGS